MKNYTYLCGVKLKINYMEKEIWKDIKSYEGLYQVSNFGRVRSLDHWGEFINRWDRISKRFVKGRILKQQIDHFGYLYVILYKNGISKTIKVHRLVAEAFLEVPEHFKHLIGSRHLQVNHKDETPLNNRVDNLEWCDHIYNMNYGTRIERQINTISKPVLQFDLEGNLVKEWSNATEAGRNGFNSGCICNCCKNKPRYYSHKGFVWKYKVINK